MGFMDRPGVARLVEAVEENIGISVITTAERDRWQVVEREYVELASDAEDLALHHMDYFGNRPHELEAGRRKAIAQRSRVALKFDPLAGAEAQLLADFTFGKGVPKPTARHEKVQQVIDEFWTDANNQEKLTGFQAQRKLSNELLTAGELFPTLYVGGGKVRAGRLDADTVVAIVPDPEDRLRPLWYIAEVRKFLWDFERHAPKVEMAEMVNGQRKVKYWKHWRNFDDAQTERRLGFVEPDEDELIEPKTELQAKGLVYHVAINQTGEELRGNPPWARTLRFFSAMNVLTEAHVTMAQGQASFIAKRVHDGTPKQVQKAAAAVLGHVSELGASRLGGGEERAAFAPDGQSPVAPGSWWNENPSSRMEAFNLKSGAGEAAQSAQIVRAPIAAAMSFGQHYLGDASQANLATASTLELPATMRFESWGTYFEGMYRWYVDRAIEAAVHAGRLGGLDDFPEDGPMSEMKLDEAQDRAAMERRTKIDLGYEFVMPFPGRRQLPEVAAFASSLLEHDPNGVNIPLRRHVLRFQFEAMGMDDVGRAVEECIPDEPIPGGIGPQEIDPETGLPMPAGSGGRGGPPAQAKPGGAKPATAEPGTKNVRRTSTPPGERRLSEAWVPEELRAAVAALDAEVGAEFAAAVVQPAVRELLALAGASGNGNGAS